jgi:hypothetical protein
MIEEQRRQLPARTQPGGLLDLGRDGGFAPRSKIKKGYSLSSRLAGAPNLWQRTRSYIMRWVLGAHNSIAPATAGRLWSGRST